MLKGHHTSKVTCRIANEPIGTATTQLTVGVPSADEMNRQTHIEGSACVWMRRHATCPFGGRCRNARLTETYVCKFFKEGKCEYGSQCQFSHVVPKLPAKAAIKRAVTEKRSAVSFRADASNDIKTHVGVGASNDIKTRATTVRSIAEVLEDPKYTTCQLGCNGRPHSGYQEPGNPYESGVWAWQPYYSAPDRIWLPDPQSQTQWGRNCAYNETMHNSDGTPVQPFGSAHVAELVAAYRAAGKLVEWDEP